jgi:hypothetical protein
MIQKYYNQQGKSLDRAPEPKYIGHQTIRTSIFFLQNAPGKVVQE